MENEEKPKINQKITEADNPFLIKGKDDQKIEELRAKGELIESKPAPTHFPILYGQDQQGNPPERHFTLWHIIEAYPEFDPNHPKNPLKHKLTKYLQPFEEEIESYYDWPALLDLAPPGYTLVGDPSLKPSLQEEFYDPQLIGRVLYALGDGPKIVEAEPTLAPKIVETKPNVVEPKAKIVEVEAPVELEPLPFRPVLKVIKRKASGKRLVSLKLTSAMMSFLVSMKVGDMGLDEVVGHLIEGYILRPKLAEELKASLAQTTTGKLSAATDKDKDKDKVKVKAFRADDSVKRKEVNLKYTQKELREASFENRTVGKYKPTNKRDKVTHYFFESGLMMRPFAYPVGDIESLQRGNRKPPRFPYGHGRPLPGCGFFDAVEFCLEFGIPYLSVQKYRAAGDVVLENPLRKQTAQFKRRKRYPRMGAGQEHYYTKMFRADVAVVAAAIKHCEQERRDVSTLIEPRFSAKTLLEGDVGWWAGVVGLTAGEAALMATRTVDTLETGYEVCLYALGVAMFGGSEDGKAHGRPLLDYGIDVGRRQRDVVVKRLRELKSLLAGHPVEEREVALRRIGVGNGYEPVRKRLDWASKEEVLLEYSRQLPVTHREGSSGQIFHHSGVVRVQDSILASRGSVFGLDYDYLKRDLVEGAKKARGSYFKREGHELYGKTDERDKLYAARYRDLLICSDEYIGGAVWVPPCLTTRVYRYGRAVYTPAGWERLLSEIASNFNLEEIYSPYLSRKTPMAVSDPREWVSGGWRDQDIFYQGASEAFVLGHLTWHEYPENRPLTKGTLCQIRHERLYPMCLWELLLNPSEHKNRIVQFLVEPDILIAREFGYPNELLSKQLSLEHLEWLWAGVEKTLSH